MDQKRQSMNKLWTKDFTLGTFINFVVSCNYFMLMVVMTAYALEVYQAPAALAALCASIFIIGTLFARVVTPPLMTHFGRKRVLLLGTAFACLLTVLYLVYTPLPVLMGIRFVHGFAYGISSTTVATIVTAIVPAARKGEGIGYYMLSATLGAAIGPFAGIILSRYAGYDVLFFFAAAILVLALVLTLWLKTPSREVSVAAAEDELAAAELEGSTEAAREERAAMRQERTTKKANKAHKKHGLPTWSSELAKFKHAAKACTFKGKNHAHASCEHALDHIMERATIPISCVCFLVFFGYSSLLTFLTPFADSVGLTQAASVYFIAYALSMFITRPFTGRAFDRLGAMPVLTPAFFSFAAGMALLAFASNDWMVLGSALLTGFGVGTSQACGLAMAVKAAPASRLSLANATFYMFVDAGVGVGPLVLGALLPVLGYSGMFVAMAAVGILAFVLFLAVRKKYQ